MGYFLNSNEPARLYINEAKKPYFVDKTKMLSDLFPLVETGNQCICITRPRRFGKTIMANMIGAFFSRGCDASVFDQLQISGYDGYAKHKNKHNVIYIDFSKADDECESYKEYITSVKEILREDLHEEFPDVKYREKGTVSEDLKRIQEATGETFVFVFDEWDYIFHQRYVTEPDKMQFVRFLSNLLKDRAYVELAYMTGILPIAKYSSGSEINMFQEYTMSTMHLYSTYFGFLDEEVDMLYARYLTKEPAPKVTRNGLREWYDGYQILADEDAAYLKEHPNAENVVINDARYIVKRMYNPRSVVFALENNQLADYWTSSGPYDEIFYYVKNDIAGVRDDIAKMIAGEAVQAQVREYSATSTSISTRDEVLSAMVVYGFLTAAGGKVSIPNNELMDKFADMVRKENALGYVYSLAKESDRMLAATKAGDTGTMASILQQAHNTETGMTGYNDEAELSAIIRLVYLSARDDYDIEREDKAGVGYVDYIFYPKKNMADDCIIVELKVDHTAEEAIWQIRNRNYAQRFIGKLGEQTKYRGRILAVGISYYKKDPGKKHECAVEVLREKL